MNGSGGSLTPAIAARLAADEIVVGEIGVLVADAVDLLDLARAQALGGIETPDALHQSLPPQDLVAAGDAAVEIVGDVEEGAVAVGDPGIERQQIGGHGVLAARGLARARIA